MKMLYFKVSHFPFPKFQITIAKIIIHFRGCYEVLQRHNFFDLHIFVNETAALLFFYFLKNLHGNTICFFKGPGTSLLPHFIYNF